MLYRNLLDLGEIPTHEKQFEEARKFDQVHELNTPPDPNGNYLAGAERSWWRVILDERLRQLENGSLTDIKEADSKKDKKSKRKSTNATGGASVNSNSASDATADVKSKSENEEMNNTQSRYW